MLLPWSSVPDLQSLPEYDLSFSLCPHLPLLGTPLRPEYSGACPLDMPFPVSEAYGSFYPTYPTLTSSSSPTS